MANQILAKSNELALNFNQVGRLLSKFSILGMIPEDQARAFKDERTQLHHYLTNLGSRKTLQDVSLVNARIESILFELIQLENN